MLIDLTMIQKEYSIKTYIEIINDDTNFKCRSSFKECFPTHGVNRQNAERQCSQMNNSFTKQTNANHGKENGSQSNIPHPNQHRIRIDW